MTILDEFEQVLFAWRPTPPKNQVPPIGSCIVCLLPVFRGRGIRVSGGTIHTLCVPKRVWKSGLG